MNFEHPAIAETNKYDDRWYEKFKELGSFQDYEYLDGDKSFRDEQKRLFIEGKIENPDLDYPKLSAFDFERSEFGLLQLKKDLLNQEQNETVKQVYRWRINEKIAELRMLKATSQGDDQRFFRYSKFIYGHPDKSIFLYTLDKIKKLVNEKVEDSDKDISEAAKRLSSELDLNTPAPKNIAISVTFPEIKNAESEQEFSAEEIKIAFEEALRLKNIDNWTVEIFEGSSKAINVSQEKKKVNIPKSRVLKFTELKSLIAHEIETHVLRRESGERSNLMLLGLGLDRYLKGEEGVATYREQEIGGATEYAGFDGYFSVSLAIGADGKQRNFRETYEILKDYYFIASTEPDKEKAKKSAENSAWNRCIRTFRGTTSTSQGKCFTKDLVYREGNIGIWNVLKTNPDEMKRFSVGKYDPANPRHIWILEQLGINDNDLAELEKN